MELHYDQLVEIGKIDQLEPSPGLGVVVRPSDARPHAKAWRSRVPAHESDGSPPRHTGDRVVDPFHLSCDHGTNGLEHGRTVEVSRKAEDQARPGGRA